MGKREISLLYPFCHGSLFICHFREKKRWQLNMFISLFSFPSPQFSIHSLFIILLILPKSDIGFFCDKAANSHSQCPEIRYLIIVNVCVTCLCQVHMSMFITSNILGCHRTSSQSTVYDGNTAYNWYLNTFPWKSFLRSEIAKGRVLTTELSLFCYKFYSVQYYIIQKVVSYFTLSFPLPQERFPPFGSFFL